MMADAAASSPRKVRRLTKGGGSARRVASETETETESEHEPARRRRGGMQLGSQSQPTATAASFRGELGSAQVLLSALRGLASGKKDQHCLVEIDQAGLRVITTDKARALQGCATLIRKVFEAFELRDEGRAMCFRVSLVVLLHCLSTLGSHVQDVNLKVAYFEADETLSLQLLEGQMVTECMIRTLCDVAGEDQERMELRSEFKASAVVNRCMLRAEQLREAFSMLQELPGAATVSVLLSPERPFFRLRTQGQMLNCAVDFPQGDESLGRLQCKREMECTYRLSLVQQAGKALSAAEKTFLRMNEQGMLSIQHLLSEGDKQTYVDFYMLADVEEGGEEEEG